MRPQQQQTLVMRNPRRGRPAPLLEARASPRCPGAEPPSRVEYRRLGPNSKPIFMSGSFGPATAWDASRGRRGGPPLP